MTTYLIAIAVENYHSKTDLPKVDYAKKDASDFVSALEKLGCSSEHITKLFDEKATQSSILLGVKKVAELASKGDRIIIYFAGHGFFESGNYLAPVDASKVSITETCVSITKVLGYLNKSASTQKLLFLDCCHSGFEPGDLVRDSNDAFMGDELVYQFRNEEFCVGFASCKSNQKSFSHPKLSNGVWSHYLVKALLGDASDIYRDGILFSDALQSYLNKETTKYVKLNTDTKRDQTPIKFGSETDNFIIADLRPIFEEREINRAHEDIPFPSIAIVEEDEGYVRSLPGFKQGHHRVPTEFGNTYNNFIESIGAALIESEIKKVGIRLREILKYKRPELQVFPKTGSIVTIDFDYEISITQSSKHPSMYTLTRRLYNFKNSAKVVTPEFNEAFENHFRTLQFESSKLINVEEIIDRIEALPEPSTITVNYEPDDTSSCEVVVVGLKYSIDVTESTIRIGTNSRTSPQALIEAYRTTSKVLALNNAIRLIQ